MIVVKTPLRISFVGGGTDLPAFCTRDDGAVVSTTIDKYVYMFIKHRPDKTFRLSYTQLEVVDDATKLRHDLIRETLLAMDQTDSGLEIHTVADVPTKGTGLGASASFTVSAIHALSILGGIPLDTNSMVEQAFQIESESLNRTLGRQDQAAAVYGGLNLFSFRGPRVIRRKLNVTSNGLAEHLVLIPTNIERDSNEILSDQSAEVQDHFDDYRVMASLAYKAGHYLETGDIPAFFDIVNANYTLKSRLSKKIETPEIVEMVDFAATRQGVVAIKLLGAGGGGTLLLAVTDLYARQKVVEEFEDRYETKEIPFKFSHFGSRVIFNDED